MKAVWITDGTGNPFYARKKIEVKNEIEKACAKVCGLGQFNFYINGKKVSDHVLDPVGLITTNSFSMSNLMLRII